MLQDCSGSICELVKTGGKSWRECEPPRDDKDSTLLCHVACAPPDNSTGACYSSTNSENADFPGDFKNILSELSNGTTKITYRAGMCLNDSKKGWVASTAVCGSYKRAILS